MEGVNNMKEPFVYVKLDKRAKVECEGLGDKLPEFGDYVYIEQKRYGGGNELYIYKVIKTLNSNEYVDIPVSNEEETIHDKTIDVVACVCCGVSERTILKYPLDKVLFIKH